MSYVSTRVLVVFAALAAGCALGDSGPDGAMTGQGWTPGNDDGGTDATDDNPADDPADDNGDAPDDDGATGASCEFGCNEPPGDCYEPNGTCDNDTCVYSPVLAGEPCTDDCSGGGFCDASGGCICASDDMGGDTGGTDGGNPADCMMTCTAGAHASAACNAMGDCIVTCESPWEDCDGDPTNGCEVPVGVPHQCDAGGLNPNGCWTAYCGSAQGADIVDFGTYHCVDCPTCEQPSAGQCHWCNHDTGTWFPQEACSCGAQYLDAVCSP